MQQRTLIIASIREVSLAVGILLGIGLVSAPATAAGQIDPEADKIVRAMSTYLGALPALSADVDVDNEIIDTAGRKLQFSASASIVAERPGKLYVHRHGPVADVEIIYDGKVLTVHGKGLNVYMQLEVTGLIEDAVNQVRAETDLDAPAGDLLYADSYTGLIEGVASGDYMGTGYVNGIECHHLAFRQAKVDWQLWVQVGDTPLPMKYVITSKWVTGAPQYSARFRNWSTNPKPSADQFAFSPPAGAKKLENIPVDEMGEFMLEGDNQ